MTAAEGWLELFIGRGEVTYLEATDPLHHLGDALHDRAPHRDDLVVIAGHPGVWQVQRCKHHPPTDHYRSFRRSAVAHLDPHDPDPDLLDRDQDELDPDPYRPMNDTVEDEPFPEDG